MGASQAKFDSGVWFSDAFLAQAEERTHLHSPIEKSNTAAHVRQVERIRDRVQFDSDRAAAAAAATAQRQRDEAAALLAAAQKDNANQSKVAALKREFAESRAAALADPRNAPVVLVPLLPFFQWRPSSSSPVVPVVQKSVVSVSATTTTTTTTAAATAANVSVGAAPPELLAEVEALRARVAEMDALRARVEEMSLVDQGRELARVAARDTEAQLGVLAAAWRASASAAQANDAKIAALEEFVAHAEATLAAPAQQRKLADAKCVEPRLALLAQLQKGGNDADAVAGLVRKYDRCVRSNE